MTLISFTLFTLILSFFAGIIGALTGLGGALITIPVMVLFLHVNIHYAMGAGLFAVMATSSGTAMAYLRSGFTNVRIGIFLEIAAAIGAVIGAYVTNFLPAHFIQVLFGFIFIVMSYFAWRRHSESSTLHTAHYMANYLLLNGSYPTPEGEKIYLVQNVWSGFSLMGLAGILSGLLGIGSGTMKVIAMDQAMQIPYKVSTSTSNFIIGITAAVGAMVFFAHGYVDPIITFPVVTGVLIGALLGAKMMPHLPVKHLRKLFSMLVLLLALEMIYQGLGGMLS